MRAPRLSRGCALAATLVLLPGSATAAIHVARRSLREVRQFGTRQAGVETPASLAFAPAQNLFYVVPGRGTPERSAASVGTLDALGDAGPSVAVGSPVAGFAAAVDAARNRLVLFDDRSNQVIEVPLTGAGASAPVPVRIAELGRIDAGGLAVDDSSGTLFVLDRGSGRVAAIPAAVWRASAGTRSDSVTWLQLSDGQSGQLRGLAFDSSARRFSAVDVGGHAVCQYDEQGALVGSLDLADISLRDPQALVWAPSGDQTDDAAAMSLYIADAGGWANPGSARIVEVTEVTAAATVSAATVPSALLNTIDTSRWSPPSPDPSGLAYDPTTNRLLVSDGEVDEMTIYKGVNYYESTLSGTLVRTTNTLAFTPEPTGVAYDSPARIFMTDDDARKVFQVSLGQNGVFDASDPVTASFSTSAFGSGDPEGVTYDKTGDRLFIADGVNAEIYEVRAVDGVFGNGNDQVLHFDTKVLGVIDPESVELNADTGTLFTIGSGGGNLVETTTSGALVTDIDTSELPLLHAAGVTLAPRSSDPSQKSIYIADRKVDNDDHPTENDGAIYEIAVGTAGSPPPTGDYRVKAGSDDAEENNASGAVNLTSSDLELMIDGTAVQTVGMRFAGLAIPQGATITNAYLQFFVDETQSETTTLTIKAQAADNAATFTTATSNVSSRPRTSASVTWSPPPWTTIGTAGADQRSPNLAALVQEVVNRPGWASGNALALIVTGSGHRTAVAYNGIAAQAPVLHVDISTGGGGGGGGNLPPIVNAGPDQTITLPASAALDGTVSDDGQPNSTPTTAWSKVSGPGTVTFADAAAVDTQATFSDPGTYVLSLTADDGALTASDEVTIVVNPAGGVTVSNVRVAAGSDDAEENNATGAVSLTSSDLELMSDGNIVQTVGMRFTGVAIPQGATITSAYIQFVVDEAQSVATTVTIKAQASDNAATFTTATGNVSARPRTSAAASWSPPAWTTIGAAGADQRTPDLAPLVQEVVNRPGWASGNALALIVTGSGHRTAVAFNGSAANAALLHVEYH